MFRVQLHTPTVEMYEEQVYPGVIEAQGLNERFFAPSSFWSKDQYVAQWKNSLGKLINGAPKAALILTMRDPKQANFIFWWVFYRVENAFKMQNQVLFLETCPDLDWRTCEECIQPRQLVNDDGAEISEWDVSLDELTGFYNSLG